MNGWTQYAPQTGAARVAIDQHNVVHFKGAIAQTAGSATVAFVLAPNYRPTRIVYTPVTLLNGAFGRLIIEPSGTVSVQAAGAFSDAQQFTSLEGVTFSKIAPPLQYSNIALKNGWQPYSDTVVRPAAAIDTNNIVRLRGAMKQTSGSIALAFRLAPEFRPNRDVYIPVNTLLGRPGRVNIHKNGDVFVQAGGAFSDAQAFTSLEGVSFSRATAPLNYYSMPLANGWQRYSLAVARPSAALDSENVVHLRGAMFQTGPANQSPFILPPKFRPNRTLFIPITLINGRPGRVVIFQSGSVLIEAAASFDDARGFTSLEGVTYSKN